MPELPEVETIARSLSSELPEHATIVETVLHRPDLRFPIPDVVRRGLVGRSLRSIWRRGKYLVFEFEQGFLISHLGMTGNWRLADHMKSKVHDHVELVFQSSNRIHRLIYNDSRRFGYLDWAVTLSQNRFLKNLGPEPLSSDFSSEYLFASTRGKTTSIKAHLMNSAVVVGIGNIYASEILFRAGVDPRKRAKTLKKDEPERIVLSTQVVLNAALAAGGSTIRDFVVLDGSRGGYQDAHQVYGRAGHLCLQCAEAKIQSRVIAGRSTFWCPTCQR